MPLYMIQVAYTPEAKAALAQVPEDRSIVFEDWYRVWAGGWTPSTTPWANTMR